MGDIIAIGSSAGFHDPLRAVLQALPSDLRATIFIVVHRTPSHGADTLVPLLQTRCNLPVEPAIDGHVPELGRVYVGPAGENLRIVDGRMRTGETLALSPGRGSIDELFRSVAETYRARSIGVVLSGALHDGTNGLWEIRRNGGIAIVQNPTDATFPSMPAHAMDVVPLHYCLLPDEIASTLVHLVADRGPHKPRARVLIVEDEMILAHDLEHRLSDLGYEIVGLVQSGEQALRIAAEIAPDVAVMDIQLAGAMRGTDAARALWERHHIPTVFLTSYSDETTIRDAASITSSFIVKPFRAPQLHAAIQIAVTRRAAHVESSSSLDPATNRR